MTAGTEPFFKIPNSVIDEAALGAYEIAVFAVLARHRNTITGECFPGIAKIAKVAGISRPRVTKSIKLLEAKGLVEIRVDSETHSQKHVYRFPCFSGENRETVLTGQRELPVNKRHAKPANHVSPNKTKVNKTKEPLAKREVDPRASFFKEAIESSGDSRILAYPVRPGMAPRQLS
jgi:hypothetical protein